MLKLGRRAIATTAAVVTLGAGGMTLAATAASAAPAGPPAPTCQAGQLYVWVSPDSANGTAGTTYYNLDVTNTGNRPCSLNGYPGVIATDSRGRTLGAAASRNGQGRAATVTIAADGTAHASLGYVDALLNRGSRPQTATFLRVSLPGVRGTRNAFFPLPVTTRGRSILTIGRVQPGA
jgi:hypothetical protein